MITVDGVTYFDHQYYLIQTLRQLGQQQGEKQFITAVEVGVASGRTSAVLLREVPNLHLWMVDHWAAPQYHPKRNQEWYDRAMQTAINAVTPYYPRFRVIKSKSAEAPRLFLYHSVDLVFIDADHKYDSVLADMQAWWPVVRWGGIFCGHDIDGPKDKNGTWGVRRAVEQFTAARGLEFTVHKNCWQIQKPIKEE